MLDFIMLTKSDLHGRNLFVYVVDHSGQWKNSPAGSLDTCLSMNIHPRCQTLRVFLKKTGPDSAVTRWSTSGAVDPGLILGRVIPRS